MQSDIRPIGNLSLNKNVPVRQVKTSWLYMSLLIFAFCFSWISPMVTSKLTGGNVIELFMVCSYLILVHSNHPLAYVINKNAKSKKLLNIILILILFSLLGLINGDGNPSYVYADFRSNLIFIFTLLVFTDASWERYYPTEKEFVISYIYFAITILDISSVYLRPFLDSEWEIAKQPLLILAPASLTILYFRRGKYLMSSLFMLAMSYQAVVGFYRFYYLTTIIIGLVILILVGSNIFARQINISSRLKSIAMVILLIIGLMASYGMVLNYWTSSESRMIHSINRTENLVNDSKSEKERIGSVSVLLDDPVEFIMPKGIGWRGFQKIIESDLADYNIISSMDSCLFYIAYHYGIIILLIIGSLSVYTIIRSFLRNNNADIGFNKMIRIVFLLLFIVSFFSHGIMFTTPQGAFVFSSFFALIIKPI